MSTVNGLAALLLLAAASAFGAENDDDSAAPATEAAEPPVAEEDAEVEALTPRGRYNLGLTQLAGAEYEAAAETFLAARDDAGPDPELRYRAAFNLGFALAHGVAEDAPPAEAIDTLRRSAAWFNDAVRLAPPSDDDARINLELVSKRVLALADQLNEGATLQARLDRLIDDQRSIRDGIRSVLQDASPSGSPRASQDADAPATADTRGITVLLEDHDAYNALASRERMLAADVGECIDLATEERLFIEQTPPDQLAPEQQGRAYQLRGVVDFLERARQSLSDARRRLRRLEGERAHRRADAALAELKRAREQLFDPLRVLQAAAQDQMRLATETAALATFRNEPERFEQAPGAWLTAKHLAERQEDVGARTGGVLGRFDAVTAAGNENADADSEALQAVAEATPIVEGGLAAMRNAIRALESDDPATALPEQTHALELLQQAIELFAGVKELIEFAFADQQHIVALLTPGDSAAPSGAERTEALFARTTDNQRRLHRLGPLLEKEVQGAAATDDEQADEQARQAAEERHRQAETLRERALDALDTLADRIVDGPNSSAARTAADEGLAALAELRRLFFTLVEHVQALRRDQADTHDATATLQFDSTADAGDDLGTRIEANASRQTQHGQFGDAIAETLARQADAANTQAASAPDADGEQAAEANAEQAAERLAEAAEELRKAGGRMHSAAAILGDAATRAQNMSPELEPALDDQLKALDHLDNALLALSPPDGEQENQNSEGEGQEAQQQAAQARQGSEEERMSQRQALKRLQAIRDREAQRQRRRGEAASREPVEKDW